MPATSAPSQTEPAGDLTVFIETSLSALLQMLQLLVLWWLPTARTRTLVLELSRTGSLRPMMMLGLSSAALVHVWTSGSSANSAGTVIAYLRERLATPPDPWATVVAAAPLVAIVAAGGWVVTAVLGMARDRVLRGALAAAMAVQMAWLAAFALLPWANDTTNPLAHFVVSGLLMIAGFVATAMVGASWVYFLSHHGDTPDAPRVPRAGLALVTTVALTVLCTWGTYEAGKLMMRLEHPNRTEVRLDVLHSSAECGVGGIIVTTTCWVVTGDTSVLIRSSDAVVELSSRYPVLDDDHDDGFSAFDTEMIGSSDGEAPLFTLDRYDSGWMRLRTFVADADVERVGIGATSPLAHASLRVALNVATNVDGALADELHFGDESLPSHVSLASVRACGSDTTPPTQR